MRIRILIFLLCGAWCIDVSFQQEKGKTKCKDKIDYCDNVLSFCDSEEYETFIFENCPKSCKKCPEDIDPQGLCINVPNGGCEHDCKVINQTKKVCQCWDGYELASNGLNCKDRDECSLPDICVAPKICYNFVGGYTCVDAQCTGENESPYMGSADCCQNEPTDAECGISALPPQRIVGGNNSHSGQWPWQVAVKINNDALCGGALLNSNWVITAGHCFQGFREGSTIDLYFGALKLSELRKSFVQKRKFKRHIMYPNYNDDEFYTNDVALIELDRPVKYNRNVRPVCLPNGEKPKVGYKCYAAGWGLTDQHGSDASNRLQHADLPVVDDDKCTNAYKDEDTPFNRTHMLCAGYDEGGKDACRGDSGGPFVCQRCSSCGWYLAGIVSFGSGCGEAGFYGVYANILHFEDWISKHTSIPVNKDKVCSGPSFTKWSEWSTCTKTCEDSGKRRRSRRCLDKGSDSDKCRGPTEQVENCPFQDCPRFGKFGEWTECTKPCGSGSRTQIRECINGNVGQDGCPSDQASRTEQCNTNTCPEWKNWTRWSTCTRTCGGGTQERTRECDGQGCDGDSSESKKCNADSCPGAWSEWIAEGECTKNCGGGSQDFRRTCNGGNCPGSSTKTENCNEQKCPELGRWTQWGTCSKTCGGGEQSRSRECLHTSNPSDCGEDLEQTRKCNEELCPGVWSKWTEWSECDVTCGEGSITRSRTCEGANVGDPGCDDGGAEEAKRCVLEPCPSRWGRWGDWSECSQSCARGTSTRTRPCDGGKIGEGACAPASDARQERDCNEIPCTECVDSAEEFDATYCGRYFSTKESCEQYPTYAQQYCQKSCDLCKGLHEPWKPWGVCSSSCGPGTRTRTRDCKHSAGCEGEAEQTENCETPCKGFESWSRWGDCSKTCGGGTRTRTRTCPFDECQADETGSTELSQKENCNETPCPGVWGSFGAWGRCSVTCGNDGVEARERKCIGGEPGGPGCLGSATRTRACRNTKACPAEWGDWSDFGDCDTNCFKWKTRTCIGGSPGSAGCPGESRESEKCAQCGSATTCPPTISDPIECRFIRLDATTCAARRVKNTCPGTCCEALKNVPCEDNPSFRSWCNLPMYCTDPNFEIIYQTNCRKTCGFC